MPPTLPLTISQLERTEIAHINRQAQAIQILHLTPTLTTPIIIQPICNGTAVRTLRAYTGKLNRVVGLGMAHAVTHIDLETLEALYGEIGLTPDVHLCEAADGSAERVLGERGYWCWGELGVYVRYLGSGIEGEGEGKGMDVVAEVEELKDPSEQEKEEFIEASIAGFAEQGRSRDLLGVLARIAVVREDTRLFVARGEGGVVVGTAALGVLDAGEGVEEGESVGHLYLDSTVPGYRGKGVHVGLIRERVRCARKMGLRVVSLSTGVEGGSKRNAEREGFELVYRKKGFVKGQRG
ncbi:hypothetical protein BO71DRAFT_475104 [Aspergillus ellipticus CBS 707.79]|uniref:N-acetyltransferase domain-containing protein n=1 Tax=Aspergillus ellipticus CBS 707.79 TaxID=1448320 RepID=A0A319DL15_9EURO|nr:hypothetical protein BO71DRAFT_475104 [Aspergillus ellipticus CBS 707.79]